MAGDKGCAYGQVNRQRIEDINEKIDELKDSFKSFEKTMETKLTDLYNHQSSRLPMWTTVMISILSSLVVGLIVYAATR